MLNFFRDISIIIEHFNKYPLLTQKRADFELYKQVVDIMNRKEHLTKEGLNKIVAMKATMNLGLPTELKEAFPHTITVPRPLVQRVQEIPDLNWLSGFVSGEGCFYVKISKLSASKLGFSVQLKFQITQHTRDSELMKSLVEWFGCGILELDPRGSVVNFIVTKSLDITEKIIPFFNKCPILGVKSLDFNDFCKVAKIFKSKGHLIPEGLEQIRKIKEGMNTGRS
jgi:hypothetical protein